MVACAQAHVAQAMDNYTIHRLRHMCLCAGNHNIGLPMAIAFTFHPFLAIFQFLKMRQKTAKK